MIKGTSQNILCDHCRTIISNPSVVNVASLTVKGKDGKDKHYCDTEKCRPKETEKKIK